MLRWQAAVGIALGLVLAAIVMGLITPWRGHTLPAPSGPMLTETDGTIRSVVLQYAHGSDFVLPVFRDFLAQCPPQITAYIACPDQAAFDECLAGVGPVPPALRPILTGHEQTAWSRDRWVALLPRPDHPTDPLTLLAPRGELNADLWPARAGDNRLADDLARHLKLASRHSPLYFDGGDFLADGDYVFATPALVARNLQCTVRTREELLQAIAAELGRKVVLMEDVPDHHAGMFMMAAGPDPDGHRVMLVADPSLAKPLLPPAPLPAPYSYLQGGPDFSESTQRRFDAAARHAQAAGYRVVRIPVVPAREAKAYITYVNVLIDQRQGQRIVYMPTYTGAEALNNAATQVWESLNYQVRPVNCTPVFPKGGTLHCLVTPLAR